MRTDRLYGKDMTTIGIFDSGIGGLSLLHELMHYLPDAQYLFYADTDHVPYGEKTNDEILRYSEHNTAFLKSQGADAIAIACNTASAIAASWLRETERIPIIAMEPAVKPALHDDEEKRVLVMATEVTLRENKLKELIHREKGEERIDLLPMPALVTFAEREEYASDEVRSYFEKQLSAYDLEKFSSIILGCTHFCYFRPLLRRMLDESYRLPVALVDGNYGTVKQIAKRLHMDQVEDTGEVFFSSVEDMLHQYNVRYFESGREITDKERLDRFRRLLNQLEESRKYK